MNQVDREAFGRYLRSLRSAQQLTQRAAADKAGLSYPYLAQIEKGQRNPPSREILSRIADAYCANEEEVFRAAGYTTDQEARKLLGGIDLRRLDWAFNTVLRDPSFALGTRMTKGLITPEVKAWVVELYVRDTNRGILNEEELEQLKEIIGFGTPPHSSGGPTE